jgi:hypothetical protein
MTTYKENKREERRHNTDKVSERRLRRIKQITAFIKDFDENYELAEEAGYFKKINGLTIKKESCRLWQKIKKEKDEERKNKKRNGEA